jgi:D-alanine-D-alanine ligase
MKIGLSYDIKSEVAGGANLPEDAFEEYDSPETVNALAAAIGSHGHQVVKLGGGRSFLKNILAAPVDFVFNISEGLGNYRSREAQVPSVLEMLGIPFAGSDPLTLAVSLEKPLTKELVAEGGVTTPRARVITSLAQMDRMDWSDFPFPVFAKPAHEGSSIGIRQASRVETPAALWSLVQKQMTTYAQPLLVEEFIPGEEITVGMVGNAPPQVVGIMRVVPKQREPNFIYSLEVKRNWRELVSYECPARLPEGVLARIQDAALRVYAKLGVRDFARIDFRVAPDGTPYFLEINPLPGLNPQSGDIVLMAGIMGWSYEKLIGAILNSALRRYGYVA